jgi:nicotinate-nucleotide pyrophosphorylase (carboxylating)
MLDNMTPAQITVCAKNLKSKYLNGRFMIEVSGGLTEDNAVSYFDENVDILSFGSLTQSVAHIDFSLKIINNLNKQ